MAATPRGLHHLARLHDIQTAYHDTHGRRITAAAESLMAVLRALRVPLERAADLPRLVSHRERELWERTVEPVVVGWVGERRPAGSTRLRLPVRLRDEEIRVRVGLEGGGEKRWSSSASSLEVTGKAEVDGIDHVALELPLPPLPAGYHDLEVEIGSGNARRRHHALLIAAPVRARGWDVLGRARPWGVFAPLYALRGREPGVLPGAEVPTFADLARLADHVADRGGSVVGTLPLLAAFLGERPYEPSPYAPVSRLFWNELYADPERALELGGVQEVERFASYALPRIRLALFEREEGRTPLGDLRFDRGGRADPQLGMSLRRASLEVLADRFFGDVEPVALEAFRARNPRADDYAGFRALVEERGAWPTWPDRLRARDVRPDDYDPALARYHLYVQWLAERQLAEAREQADSRGVGLYLDLPLGVHPDGYDVWRDRELFARGASAGAPPDALAAGGQDWGFPPMHPEATRHDRHRYFVAAIRKHLRFARVLRIDHVMQLHRMYWVPDGDASRGVYVRYPAEELYAVLCLESHRAGAVIVGEDLGTVPRAVRQGMKRHGLPGMYVLQFELADTTAPPADGEVGAGGRPALEPKPVPAGALASIGTHDTPTFAGWWLGRDAEIRRELGQVPPEEAEAELRGRADMRDKLARGVLPLDKESTSAQEVESWDVETGSGGGSGAPRASSSERPSSSGPSAADGPADPGAAAGWTSEREGRTEAERRRAGRVHGELLRRMGRSPAGLVLATMEDLWLETEPQNVPGTTGEWNWRRRAARPLSALEEPEIAGVLEALNAAREGQG